MLSVFKQDPKDTLTMQSERGQRVCTEVSLLFLAKLILYDKCLLEKPSGFPAQESLGKGSTDTLKENSMKTSK